MVNLFANAVLICCCHSYMYPAVFANYLLPSFLLCSLW